MSEENKKLMTEYDITSESKLIYRYKQHRYENLKDTVNFAKIDTEHAQEDRVDKTTEE